MLRTFSTNRGTLKVMTIAVCPGSYDPVTAGHLDVIERCARFFDEVHVVVAVNAAKTPMFSEETRVEIIRQALAKRGCTNVKVASTTGLITDYCTKIGATVIVKGLRQNGDYEAELGMALVNSPEWKRCFCLRPRTWSTSPAPSSRTWHGTEAM